MTSPTQHDHPSAALDRVGMMASSICAVHCLLTPFAVLFLPFLANIEAAHYVIAATVVPLAGITFIRGYRYHRLKQIPAIGFVGVALLLFSLLHLSGQVGAHEYLFSNEFYMNMIASGCLIWAHWNNIKNFRCQTCEQQPPNQ